jgi:putative Mn2+ efflux pump MntP
MRTIFSIPPLYSTVACLALGCFVFIVLPNPISSRAALAGAILAVLGVIMIGRPIARLGYFEWLRQSRSIYGGSFSPTPEERENDRQNNLDAQAVQIMGPLLIAIGTLLNGASGYIPASWTGP